MKPILSSLLALAVWFAPLAALAVDLTLIESRVLDSVPLIQPDWAQPDDPGQVFYVQRSMNPNTVVYVAQIDAVGAWANPPITAYWRRYNTDGSVRALSFLENRFAYGVQIRDRSGAQWQISLRALPDLVLVLATDSQGAGLFLQRDAGALRLTYAYLTLDETGLAPRVTRMVLVGRNTATGAIEQLTYAVTGAAIQETR